MAKPFIRFFIKAATGCGMLFLLAGLSGCGPGLPDSVKQSAGNISAAVKTAKTAIEREQDKYKQLKGSKEFKPIARFAKDENWENKFVQANQTVIRARELLDKQLSPLIKKNKPESAPQVSQLIKRIRAEISAAQDLSRHPATRFALLKTTIANAETTKDKAVQHAGQIHKTVDNLQSGPFTKALSDFPDNKEGINARIAPFLDAQRRSADHLIHVEQQFSAHKNKADADYAAFADNALALEHSLDQLKKQDVKTRQEFKQLYQSYTKVLKDMKVTYQVTVKRESWNENSDFYDPRFASFTREVPPDVYDVLAADNIDTIGEIKAGFSGSRFSSKVGDTWNKLNIKPGENWPGRGHNAASFWVEDTKEAYFHKYLLEKDGETSETNWQKVDETVYDTNLEYLGMALLAKPYGTFEKDSLTQAAPPGMAYVGNAQYGEWKEDDSGNRFWSWYGKYAFFSHLFFFPPYYYGYNSWHGWRNNHRYKKPYFGKTKKGFKQFGTNGTFARKTPMFQKTAFAKSGGFKSQTSSVRGAASGLRGGGPKGKGK